MEENVRVIRWQSTEVTECIGALQSTSGGYCLCIFLHIFFLKKLNSYRKQVQHGEIFCPLSCLVVLVFYLQGVFNREGRSKVWHSTCCLQFIPTTSGLWHLTGVLLECVRCQPSLRVPCLLHSFESTLALYFSVWEKLYYPEGQIASVILFSLCYQDLTRLSCAGHLILL